MKILTDYANNYEMFSYKVTRLQGYKGYRAVVKKKCFFKKKDFSNPTTDKFVVTLVTFVTQYFPTYGPQLNYQFEFQAHIQQKSLNLLVERTYFHL